MKILAIVFIITILLGSFLFLTYEPNDSKYYISKGQEYFSPYYEPN